ncbi:MAG: UDP-N-acetylglucosamine 2-epimerase [Opitutales bacterium]|nr:UDP-N-acetylglucosamine 2-epimerase [Opitutales bacterium]
MPDQKQPKKKLLFVTGSRGEWGYIRPILKLCEQHPDVEYSLCVTNMHLSPSFGMPINEILADGFRIDHKVYMSIDGYNHYSMVKSLGIFMSSFADIVASDRPDWIVLAGDRGEQLMGATVGAFCYIPVAHIQAGELSGNIDGMTRHAIGKYTHLHLAANQDAADRLIKLGESDFRVHNVGAPQIDELEEGFYSDIANIEQRLNVDLSEPYVMVVQHSVTEEYEEAEQQIQTTMEALARVDLKKIVILPNNDAGSHMIRKGIERARIKDFHVFANLKRQDYLGLLKNSQCIVGNSSSGLLEAPTFKTPAVNIGNRQNQRVQGMNVINCPFEVDAILASIKKAKSDEFRSLLRSECVNPYGDGKSSQRILDLLVQTPVNDQLLSKHLTY